MHKAAHLFKLQRELPNTFAWVHPMSDGIQHNGDSENIKSNYATLDNDVKCASKTTKSGSKVINMCIVPVKIKYEDNNKMVITYAMLDIVFRALSFLVAWLRNWESKESR